MKSNRASIAWTCLLAFLLGLLSLTGCSQKVAYQEDLAVSIKAKRLQRKELDNIAYQVRETFEQRTREGFALDFESYDDRLTYWLNAEMVNICGLARLEAEPTEEQPRPEIVGANVVVIFKGFILSSDQSVDQVVYAALDYRDGQWQVTGVREITEKKSDVGFKLDGQEYHCVFH